MWAHLYCASFGHPPSVKSCSFAILSGQISLFTPVSFTAVGHGEQLSFSLFWHVARIHPFVTVCCWSQYKHTVAYITGLWYFLISQTPS